METALAWEARFGIAPAITSVLSEYDAAMLVGLSEEDFAAANQGATSVRRGYDFAWRGVRYQVKANRPSGKPGSAVTLVAKARNYDFDVLIWLLYDRHYSVVEAWRFDVDAYRQVCELLPNVRPKHMRQGVRILP